MSCTAPGTDHDGCVGLPLAGTRVRVTDADGVVLSGVQVGELQISGEQVSPGYWDEQETDAHTADGWFRTGDLALIEPDGRLRLMGRLKEMAVVSGFNVYPAEIEALVQQHADVRECAAVAAPDERTGDALTLFVVLRAGGRASEVERFVREKLVGYKRPRQVVALEVLPKTSVGKIVKAELALLAQAAPGS